MKFETTAVHGGEKDAHFEGAVTVPIFQSANFKSDGGTEYGKIRYARLSNTPNHDVLHQKLAELEEGEAALVTASGMGAISTVLLSILKPGDHMLVQECVYGGTFAFLQKDLGDLGVTVSWIDVEKPDSWEKLVRPSTKIIYVESIANPLTTVGELDAVASFAKRNNLVSVIDSTLTSPFYFKPLKIGFDLVVHSATKYLNGHSDIVAGAVIGNKGWIKKVKAKLDHLGASLDPHACFLLNRGIKTLALRMRQHQINALTLAKYLEAHGRVKRVFYPGLESHPQFKTAKRLFSGFGGLLSFEMHGDVKEADAFLKKLKIPLTAASLGGVETLITRPATTSHLGVPPSDRKKMGISDSLIRVALGIENSEDLVQDFEQAFLL
jgi:cystathionine beta-lyase/cystathionine gamma-synthase